MAWSRNITRRTCDEFQFSRSHAHTVLVTQIHKGQQRKEIVTKLLDINDKLRIKQQTMYLTHLFRVTNTQFYIFHDISTVFYWQNQSLSSVSWLKGQYRDVQ